MPKITDENETYWHGLREGKLLVQRCLSCEQLQFYPRFFCIHCHGRQLEWVETKGIGTVYTFTVIRRAPSAAFENDVPYLLALVELEEGIRMMSRVVQIEPEHCRIGLPVKWMPQQEEHDLVLPVFTPASSA